MGKNDDLSGQYVVFSERDFTYEQSHFYRRSGMELYDTVNSFSEQSAALEYSIDNLPCLLIDKRGIIDAKDSDTVILGVRPDGKFRHYDYGGGSDIIYSWDIYRVQKSSVLDKLSELSTERNNPVKYVIGLEKKLL